MDLPSRKAEAVNKRFEVENNTLKRVMRDDADDKKKGDILEVELGDEKQPDFKPQAKIKRWKNEVNFSLRRKKNWKNPNVRTESIETGAKVKVQDEDEELHMYELDGFEDGGLEVETILKQKPKGKNANQIEFTLETKGLEFFYQPEITDEQAQEQMRENDERTLEEIKRDIRPENVVGSYAVYHESKANNEYKTGKAFHIYRPHITGADGNETWGEIDIDEESGLLTVTVPQRFLDKAVYPVVVDPTFGYTTIGGSNTSYTEDFIFTVTETYSPSSNGTVDSYSFYVEVLNNGSGSKIEMGIYDGTTLVDESYPNIIQPPEESPGWYTANSSGNSSVSSSAAPKSPNTSSSASLTF